MERKIYEHCVYESADNNNVSLDVQKNSRKDFWHLGDKIVRRSNHKFNLNCKLLGDNYLIVTLAMATKACLTSMVWLKT